MLLFITTAYKNGRGFHRFGVCILFLRELLKRVLCRRLEECSTNTSKINFINCHYV